MRVMNNLVDQPEFIARARSCCALHRPEKPPPTTKIRLVIESRP